MSDPVVRRIPVREEGGPVVGEAEIVMDGQTMRAKVRFTDVKAWERGRNLREGDTVHFTVGLTADFSIPAESARPVLHEGWAGAHAPALDWTR